jgi:oxygen-dependent protoporphyrinogen oxidase
MSKTRVDVVVAGAGISGLACAHQLHSAGRSVLVADKAESAGGVIRSVREDGYLIEVGPNSTLQTKASLGELISSAGVFDRLVPASESARNRYIVRGGELRALPMSPPALFSTRLFSPGARLRVFREPFIGRGTEKDEAVSGFFRRRFGPEIADYAVDPFVSGVYAGDPDRLGVRSAFPMLADFESGSGSVIKGAIRAAKERKRSGEKRQKPVMISFDEGMQTLTDALAAKLGEGLRLGTEVVSLGGEDDGSWRVRLRSAQGDTDVLCDNVVVATPADVTADFIGALDHECAAGLRQVAYAPVASVYLGFDRGAVAHPLDGLGFLVPSKERRNVLGTIFSSSLFPGRAPDGSVALTVFAGGVRRPDVVGMGDGELVAMVLAELSELLGTSGEPAFTKISRWQRAIPQYNIGHFAVVDHVRALEERHKGLYFCTNFAGGISVGDCVETAAATANRVGTRLSAGA